MIDLRSDTVTQPTPEMRRAMAEAEVGDDVFGEDPTVNRLEALAAGRMGKEAALFVASGTMANLVSALTHCQRGAEMVLGTDAHIFVNEVGGVAALGGIQVKAIPNDSRGKLDPETVEQAIRPDGLHFPSTGLVCMENTHNRGSGAAFTAQEMGTVTEVAHAHGVPVHLDGARIFNAAIALGVSPSSLAAQADTLNFCLSKGLSCPVGSVVCGSAEFIARARKTRKMVGGGMRQAGVLAAAGIVALEHMVDRLAEDHNNANRLAQGLAQLPGVVIDPSQVQTNIVIVEMVEMPPLEFISALKERGILANYNLGRRVRFVTHHGINAEDIDEALDASEAAIRGKAHAG
jgi:threonine aldolase